MKSGRGFGVYYQGPPPGFDARPGAATAPGGGPFRTPESLATAGSTEIILCIKKSALAARHPPGVFSTSPGLCRSLSFPSPINPRLTDKSDSRGSDGILSKAPKRPLERVKARPVGFIRRAGLDALQGPIRSSEGQGERVSPPAPEPPGGEGGVWGRAPRSTGAFSPPLGAYLWVCSKDLRRKHAQTRMATKTNLSRSEDDLSGSVR